MSLTYGEALKTIGGLSKPSKMPWWSWSISATGCITGSKLVEVERSTCSGCYALKGMYRFQNVINAMNRREAALSDPKFVDAFVCVLLNLHANTRSTYKARNGRVLKENRFRWFDSGDLRSVEMLRLIVQIAERTPKIKHWLPTREFGIVRAFLKSGGVVPKNLLIRMSAPMIGERPKAQPFGLPFSGVDVQGPDIWQCPAKKQGGFCLDCSRCWGRDNVSYYPH